MNKFNIYWQIVRVRARKPKDVRHKIEYIKQFINDHPNIYNFDRVLNWAKMTKIAYPDPSSQRSLFDKFIEYLEENEDNFNIKKDMPNDLTKVDIKSLKMVYNDLKKRKYGFQFKNAPRDHIEFMKDLETEINKRVYE